MHPPRVDDDVLVVGAGPTGLALALALARAGVRARVIDRRSGIAPQSRALDVQARTLELYRALGVTDRLLELGVRVREVTVRDAGRTASRADVTGLGAGLSPYPFLLCCPQDDHEALLVRELAATGVPVEWGSRLETLDDDGDGVLVTVVGADDVSRTSRVAYVAGCDGAGSTVRRQAGIDFPGRSSGQRYLVADVTATGGAAAPAADGQFSFCLSRDDFLLVVPARRTGTSRVIGLVPAGLTGREEVTFEDVRAAVERTTGSSVEALHWFSTYHVAHRVAERFRQGRVLLLGDAAHVHSPLGGQGMNTGIGDAANLAWKLAAVLRGEADPSLLDSYPTERRPVARSLVATTDRLFGLVAGPGRRQRLARRLVLRTLLPAALRWPPSRDRLARGISQLDVRYRSSPLSGGRAGPLRGGDRLPWLDLGGGHDNHEPLAGLSWQLHVHGPVPDGLQQAAVSLGLPLQTYDWGPAARRAGFRRGVVYLVRPDGYLAYVLRLRPRPGHRPVPVATALGRALPAGRGAARGPGRH